MELIESPRQTRTATGPQRDPGPIDLVRPSMHMVCNSHKDRWNTLVLETPHLCDCGLNGVPYHSLRLYIRTSDVVSEDGETARAWGGSSTCSLAFPGAVGGFALCSSEAGQAATLGAASAAEHRVRQAAS